MLAIALKISTTFHAQFGHSKGLYIGCNGALGKVGKMKGN